MATLVWRGRPFHPHDASDPLNHLSIGVLYGGPSVEREVSLESGENVARALSHAGRTVQRVILDDSFDVKIARSLEIDVAFLALHGEFGEDGRIQIILEEAGIPYTGSGVDASSRAFDKLLAKREFEKNGILTPAWMSFDHADMEALGGIELNPPLVVKPANGGSSLGVTIVRRPEQTPAALRKALEFDDTAIAERFVAGRELTVAILGDEPLLVVELKVGGEFFDYRAKYKDDSTRILCPADLPREIANRVQAAALATHRALGCRDVSRVDIILDSHGLPWVLEINTLPGLTFHSLLPRAAEATGISLVELCEFLLLSALSRSTGKGCRAA